MVVNWFLKIHGVDVFIALNFNIKLMHIPLLQPNLHERLLHALANTDKQITAGRI